MYTSVAIIMMSPGMTTTGIAITMTPFRMAIILMSTSMAKFYAVNWYGYHNGFA